MRCVVKGYLGMVFGEMRALDESFGMHLGVPALVPPSLRCYILRLTVLHRRPAL